MPLFAVFLFLLCTGQAFGEVDDVKSLRDAFLKHLTTREEYLHQLVTIRYKIISSDKDIEVSTIDEEVKRYPMPSTADSKLLSKLRVGHWESPRHDYLYRSDYSWTMLPVGNDVTHGLWEIEGNKYYDWVPILFPTRYVFKIILLDDRYFVFTDGEHIEYEKRLK